MAEVPGQRRKPSDAKKQAEAILARAAHAGDMDARNKLVETYLPFVRRVAERYNLPHHTDDLVQEGVLALYREMHRFDPDKGGFMLFAYYALRHAMTRYSLANVSQVAIPAWAYTVFRKISKARRAFQDESLSEEALSKITGETSRKVRIAISRVEKVCQTAASSFGLQNADIYDTSDPEEEATQKDDINKVRKEVARLPGRQREAVMLTFGFNGEPLSDRNAAKVMGNSRQRVERLRGKAYLQLRDTLQEVAS